MFPWLMIWAPQLHFPWSGSVAQQIDPGIFFAAIPPRAGNARVEQRAFEVASYGRQLGWLTEIVTELADQQPPKSRKAAHSLKRLKEVQAEIEKIKDSELHKLAADVEAQLLQLQKSDPAAFARLGTRLGPLLLAAA